jgi:hypothetical protein
MGWQALGRRNTALVQGTELDLDLQGRPAMGQLRLAQRQADEWPF